MNKRLRVISALISIFMVLSMCMSASADSWHLWRGDASNNGIVNVCTPRSSNEASLKWATDVTEGWSASSTVIDGDYIYIATDSANYPDSYLKKINRETGEVSSEVLLNGIPDWSAHLCCADGVIYVPLNGGAVQALDMDELTTLWTSDVIVEGAYNVSPLYYSDGYLYSGTYGSGSDVFYCINVADENTETSDEEKSPLWTFSDGENPYGYYWAGAVVSGNAVIFGGEAGTVYSVDKTNGEQLDTYDAGDVVRSSMMLYYGKVYFTAKDGNLHVVNVNEDGTFGDASVVDLNVIESTSTPAVYNGRVYVGGKTETGGAVCVVDAYTLQEIYSIPVEANVQSSPLIAYAYADATQKVYIYVTYNASPGGIKVIEDFYGNTDPIISDLFVPADDYANYCIASVTADNDGTLYFTNDSTHLFAIEKSEYQYAPVSLSVVPANAKVVITDPEGEVVEATSAGNYDLPAGIYEYEASLSGYKSKSDSFEITLEQAELHEAVTLRISLVRKVTNDTGDRDKVYFSLIGDTVHETPDAHEKDVTWISSTKVYIESGDTVFTVFDKVLTDKGFDYEEKSYSYISSVTASEKYDSITLEEFDNGPGAGWMYTVNDEYPMYGMRDQVLENGDKILVYYTDDYTLEPPSFEFKNTNSVKPGTVVGGGGSTSFDTNEKETDENAEESEEKAADTEEDAEQTPPDESLTDDVPSVEAEPVKFSDVADGHWAAESISLLASKGIINGRGDGTFDTDGKVTRAEFVTMLARLSGDEIASLENTFSDVSSDSYYADYVAWAVANNIVSGNDNGEFMPDKNISREDAAVILIRYMAYKNMELPEDGEEFADADSISDYAKEAVKYAKAAGIINGKGENVFAPKASVTRAETAKILAWFLK